MKPVHLISALIVLAAAAIGVARTVLKWDGAIYVPNAKYFQNERNPAAIRRTFDYSQFEGEPLKIRSLQRLIEGAEVVAKEGSVGISLGHFVTKGEDGRGQLACDYYGKVIMTFEGEGIMEFGEKPVLTIEAPCHISADINRIETIWFPFERIMSENSTPARFLETSYPEQKGVYFKFDNMTSEWPREWTLTSVRLYSEVAAGREVSLPKSDLMSVIKNPLTLTF